MLSEKNNRTIKEIVDMENADEFITSLLGAYAAKGPENAIALLRRISFVAEVALKEAVESPEKACPECCAKQQNTTDGEIAMPIGRMLAHLLAYQDIPGIFWVMTPVCMCLFPKGKMLGTEAQIEKRFFQEFLDILENHFDWHDAGTVNYAHQKGFLPYLKLVAQNASAAKTKPGAAAPTRITVSVRRRGM